MVKGQCNTGESANQPFRVVESVAFDSPDKVVGTFGLVGGIAGSAGKVPNVDPTRKPEDEEKENKEDVLCS